MMGSVQPAARSRRVAAYPSSWGISMSIKIKSSVFDRCPLDRYQSVVSDDDFGPGLAQIERNNLLIVDAVLSQEDAPLSVIGAEVCWAAGTAGNVTKPAKVGAASISLCLAVILSISVVLAV